MIAPDSRLPVEPRVEARADSVLRCASCHGDLAARHYTCSGCGVSLHHDCRLGLERCTTIGCGVRVGPRPDQSRQGTAQVVPPSLPPQRRGVLFHLVWLVPGLLSFVWPVWGWLLGDNPLALIFGVLLGPMIGHGCLAMYARANDDPGSPHVRAFIAEAVGFTASWVALSVGFVAFVLWAAGS